MPFNAKVYRILVASPSDLRGDRETIAETIYEWNAANAQALGIVLLPVLWEVDAVPEMGNSPQNTINAQLVDISDIILGAFWTRVGTPTDTEDSGTIEEIKRGLKLGKKVYLYFCDRSLKLQQVDTEQIKKLEAFKSWASDNGIYYVYKSGPQLKSALLGHLSQIVHRILADPIRWAEQKQTVIDNAEILPSNSDTVAPAENQRLLADAALSEFIRQRVGESPLDTGLMRRDLSNKACLNLTEIGGFRTSARQIEVPFSITNDGRHPAFNVSLNVENAGESIFSTTPIRKIDQGGGSVKYSLRLDRSPRRDPPENEYWTFIVTAKFKDGLGEDSAKFVFHMEGQDPNFRIYEDTSKAEFHRLCEFTRP